MTGTTDENKPAADNNGGASRLVRFFFLETNFALLLLIMLCVGGVIAYQNMVKESSPDLAIGAATVTTVWGGADPETIEQEVTNPLEKQIKSVKGLKRMLSGSYSGYSVISVEFDADVPQADAMTRLRAKVSEAEAELPRDVETPAVVEASISDAPILSIALFGDIDQALLSDVASDLQDRLEKTQGVNKVNVSGQRDEVIQVRLIGARLAAMGVSPAKIKDALQQANLDMPWGEFEGEQIGAGFRLYGKFRDVQMLSSLPIMRGSNGRVVRLSEVADVKRGFERERNRASISWEGSPYQATVGISLTKRPGADSIATIERVKVKLEAQSRTGDWPPTLSYRILSDQSVDIWDSLASMFNNGWQAMLAVFAVLLISLTWREAIVAGLAIPVTFAAALIIVWALGYTLNQIVIVGMVLALGLLVDVFILMMEGLHESIFVEGKSFEAAARHTLGTYVKPAMAGLLTTVFAMAPLLGIGGIEGKFIRAMPTTAIACLFAAFVVALFIAVPLSKFLLGKTARGGAQKTAIDRITEKAGAQLRELLQQRFLGSKGRAGFWVGVAVLVFLLGEFLFTTLPSEIMPKDDGRNLGVTIEMSPDTSLESSQVCADSVGVVLRKQDYFDNVTKLVGKKSPFSMSSIADQLTPSEGNYFIGFSAVFTPLEERDKLGFEYVPELRSLILNAMDACPGGELLITPSSGGASAEDPIQINILGDDISMLRNLAGDVAAELAKVNGATDVHNNLGAPKNDIKARPKQEALSFYGMSVSDLAEQVRLMMEADEVGTFAQGGVEDDLKIKMGYAWPLRNGEMGGATSLVDVYVMNVIAPDGRGIPLLSVVDVEMSATALSILHRAGERTVTVLAKTSDRTANEILADLQPTLNKMQEGWPGGYEYQIGGEAEASAEVFGSAGIMLLLALFLVFALLVIVFDSFVQPFIVMSAIPLALTGTFFGFYLLSMPFSFMAMIGIIALIGIVVNDTIVMLETMNRNLKAGASISEAAASGAASRLRPIVTTSVTTIAGMIPLAITQAMWLPLAVTVISGLIVSTVLALLIVPCLYILFTRSAHAEKLANAV